MLVLSRKEAEEILIGKDIRVVVVRIGGDKVRIGVEAPPEVKVVRRELVDGNKHPLDERQSQCQSSRLTLKLDQRTKRPSAST